MTNPNGGTDGADSGLHAELAQPPYPHDLVEAVPDHSANDAFREGARVVEAAHAAPVQVQYVEAPIDVSATTDPHRDNASATGMNDSSHSDSPIAAEHDTPVEAASDPVPETPPEPEKHEEPPPPEPEHHEPAAPDPAPVSTEGTEHHDSST
jgi:hypothetical protein